MARRFRFRVRKGHQIHTFGDDGSATHGPGHEFVLSEREAAELLRRSYSRRAYELVEIIHDATSGPPRDAHLPDQRSHTRGRGSV